MFEANTALLLAWNPIETRPRRMGTPGIWPPSARASSTLVQLRTPAGLQAGGTLYSNWLTGSSAVLSP